MAVIIILLYMAQMVTEDRATPLWHRRRMLEINELGSVLISDEELDASAPTAPIVVEASAPGLKSMQISIPTSVDVEKDGVLATAAAGAGKKVVFN
jgi:hypothetical protein